MLRNRFVRQTHLSCYISSVAAVNCHGLWSSPIRWGSQLYIRGDSGTHILWIVIDGWTYGQSQFRHNWLVVPISAWSVSCGGGRLSQVTFYKSRERTHEVRLWASLGTGSNGEENTGIRFLFDRNYFSLLVWFSRHPPTNDTEMLRRGRGDKQVTICQRKWKFYIAPLNYKNTSNILRRRVTTVRRSCVQFTSCIILVMNVVRPHKVIVRLFVRGTN